MSGSGNGRRCVAGARATAVVVVAGWIAAGVLAGCGSPSASGTTTGSTSSTSSTTSATSATSATTTPAPATTTPPHLPLAPLSTLGTLKSPGQPGPLGFEGVPIPNGPPLATTATAATGQVVDGISCDTNEQLLFHIHAHLTIFVNGSPRQVPYGIGIPDAQVSQTQQGPAVGSGACFYWLHTHAADGIVHIESPIVRTYTLGNFFDEWGIPLGPDQLGPYKGRVTTLYDGQVYTGDPRDVPLEAHAQVQLELGTPLVAPVQFTFPTGL
jgi:hypothetical protein